MTQSICPTLALYHPTLSAPMPPLAALHVAHQCFCCHRSLASLRQVATSHHRVPVLRPPTSTTTCTSHLCFRCHRPLASCRQVAIGRHRVPVHHPPTSITTYTSHLKSIKAHHSCCHRWLASHCQLVAIGRHRVPTLHPPTSTTTCTSHLKPI